MLLRAVLLICDQWGTVVATELQVDRPSCKSVATGTRRKREEVTSRDHTTQNTQPTEAKERILPWVYQRIDPNAFPRLPIINIKDFIYSYSLRKTAAQSRTTVSQGCSKSSVVPWFCGKRFKTKDIVSHVTHGSVVPWELKRCFVFDPPLLLHGLGITAIGITVKARPSHNE